MLLLDQNSSLAMISTRKFYVIIERNIYRKISIHNCVRPVVSGGRRYRRGATAIAGQFAHVRGVRSCISQHPRSIKSCRSSLRHKRRINATIHTRSPRRRSSTLSRPMYILRDSGRLHIGCSSIHCSLAAILHRSETIRNSERLNQLSRGPKLITIYAKWTRTRLAIFFDARIHRVSLYTRGALSDFDRSSEEQRARSCTSSSTSTTSYCTRSTATVRRCSRRVYAGLVYSCTRARTFQRARPRPRLQKVCIKLSYHAAGSTRAGTYVYRDGGGDESIRTHRRAAPYAAKSLHHATYFYKRSCLVLYAPWPLMRTQRAYGARSYSSSSGIRANKK
ncbi:unnamed protein product [Trichogramma brassicae]|uniref:Uncharacterized protein n=1 Tax=Trichogramma brassicae TaxID=86971 RepID=A0A6H5IR31_9HYME|nr:unnamed protein product [Trichogramma brassicae]